MYSLKLCKTVNKIIHVKSKKCTREVPKFINVYFILLLCMFGFDFGFKKTLSKYLRMVFSCVQLCVFITMCVFLIFGIGARRSDDYIVLVFVIQYLTHCTILLFSKYNVYDLIIDVYTLDGSIMEAVNMKFGFMLYFYTIFSCGLKQTLCVINCMVDSTHYCVKPFPGYFLCIPFLGLDVVTIIHILICYYVYRSVKYIKISLDHVSTKIVQERYHSVVTYCDKIRPLNSAYVSVVIFLFNCTFMRFVRTVPRGGL